MSFTQRHGFVFKSQQVSVCVAVQPNELYIYYQPVSIQEPQADWTITAFIAISMIWNTQLPQMIIQRIIYFQSPDFFHCFV